MYVPNQCEALNYHTTEAADFPQEHDVDAFWAAIHQIKQISSITPMYVHTLPYTS